MTMIHIPRRITRQFLFDYRGLANFIYGDTRSLDGDGGQAKQARGEPNAWPVMVKYFRCVNDECSFLTDNLLEENVAHIRTQMERVPRELPIIVFPKLGGGWNKMQEKAPRTYDRMREIIRWYAGDMLINPEDL